MQKELPFLEFSFLRKEIVGVDTVFPTPYGKRVMTYCDYTASGRSLFFVEQYLMKIQKTYANTHTEDDITGRSMTQLLHQAEESIKKSVNAGETGKLVAVGSGSTGAIDKFQQIIGVAFPPVTRSFIESELMEAVGEDVYNQWQEDFTSRRPVVFVGPYEHHSNEVTWKEGIAEVIEVEIDGHGGIDLIDLEQKLSDPRFAGRLKIGSFSAASNVTGLLSPVKEIAKLLHKNNALACFDYAASAPYVNIDMNPEGDAPGEDSSMDAVFISPHKFVGGPGASGVLVLNERVYHKELSPSVGGGGTVEYVGKTGYDFVDDIEEREKAGTPGVLQTMKAGLVFKIKDAIGADRIEAREQEMLKQAFDSWQKNKNIEILGNQDPEKRLSIVSFNIREPKGKYLHPKLITILLNDLFGIQSRAGCSCAGPYGHTLLGIDENTSQQYRHWVLEGFAGIKPGWCRIGFHFVMDDQEVQYIIDAVNFIADHGYRFMSDYLFDMKTASWVSKRESEPLDMFSLRDAIEKKTTGPDVLPDDVRYRLYDSYMEEAKGYLNSLPETPKIEVQAVDEEVKNLQFFSL